MKKLRVYYKSSLLTEMKHFEVASPEEGKRLIEALESTTGDIIKENNMYVTASLGTYSIGLEEFCGKDNTWYEWMHPETGRFIEETEDLTA